MRRRCPKGGNPINVVAAPKLTITSLGNSVVLSWPTNAVGFNLVQSYILSNWTNGPAAPSVVGGNYNVTNSLGATNTYFR